MPETHEIHTSERRSFRSCRRRWDWAYRQHYLPVEQPKALAFGIAYHRGIEAFYNPSTWTTTSAQQKMNNAQLAFGATCEEQKSQYLRATQQRHLTPEDQADYDERVELARGMFDYYATTIHPREDTWFHPVRTEQSFEIPLTNDDGTPMICRNSPSCGQTHPNPTSVTFAGRVDAIVKDLINGGYFIVDHKTATQLLNPHDNYLPLDDQIAGYTAALKKVLGINIKGFVYAEYRKDFPHPPLPLKRKNGGRLLSTSKTNATDYDTFYQALVDYDEIGNIDAYDDYLTYLKSDDAPRFYQRFTIYKNDKELVNVLNVLHEESLDMIDDKLRIYPTTGRFTCTGCAYKEPCIGKFRGDDYTFTLNSLFNKVEKR